MKAQRPGIIQNSKSLSQPITRTELILVIAALYATFTLLSFLKMGSDYLSDDYHVIKVEQYVKEALKIQQESQLSAQEKDKVIRILQDMAYGHNGKITRKSRSNINAINNLNPDALRIERSILD